MKNYDTPGMEFLHSYSIPEDRALVFRSDGETITKVWDSSGHAFEIPSAKDLNMLSHFPAYRAGEYNSGGDYGFELHDENGTKTSWWTPATGSIVFVKIASGSSRMATQVNIETGVMVGDTKPYIVVGNGSFHGIPEANPGDIHFAVDLVTQWAIIISGYGSIAETLSSLFTYKDIDLRLSFDLDCQHNLVNARLAYAGIWYGVYKLWHPNIIENPIQTSKGWYFPELIGVNNIRAVFLYLARQGQGRYFGMKAFAYATKTWTNEPSPIVAGGAPVAGGAVQFEIGANRYMLTVTPNDNVYMVWLQYQTYYSSGWKLYYKYVARKRNATGWDAETVFREGSQAGLTPSVSYVGGHFNNNDFGFACYYDSSNYLVANVLASGTWGGVGTITTTPDTSKPVSFVKTESNFDRAYMLYRNDPATVKALYGAVYSGGSWASTQLDDASGNTYVLERMAVVDDAEKAIVAFCQGPGVLNYILYSRFYDSSGWGSLTYHGASISETFMVHQCGCAYNGSVAVVAVLGLEFSSVGMGSRGLWVDRYDGSSWSGPTCLEVITNLFPATEYKEFDLPCYIDSNNNIYICYHKTDPTTPADSFVKVAYYDAATSTWAYTTLNTSPNDNMYMCGSGDRVLIAWAQNNQVYACLGEDGTFTSPKRISYYNPQMDFCNCYDPVGVSTPPAYIPPLIAMYGGQYLAMMSYARNRNFPPDVYDGYYGEKEAVIANTGYFSI